MQATPDIAKDQQVVEKVSAPAPASGAPPDYSIHQALLAAIVASSDDAIVSKTLDGIIQTWNAGAARIFGYEAEEVIGKSITIIIPPELRQEEAHILERVGRGERVDHFDTTRVTKAGMRVHVSLTVSPVRDACGNIIGASKVARDITDRKLAEEALRASEGRLGAETHALVQLNEWSARLWRCRTLGDGMQEILGATLELVGADQGTIHLLDSKRGILSMAAQRGFEASCLDSIREVRANEDSVWGRALRVGQIIEPDVTTDGALGAICGANGLRSVTCTCIDAADGWPHGIVSAYFPQFHRPSVQELRRLDLYLRQASDLIRRCEMEQTLRQREESLRDADRRKDEFLALLAHELRNPLAPIRYALATNKKAECTQEQRRRAEDIIDRQVAHMSRLLDDLLDVSRITRGTLELKTSATELASIIGAAIETARPLLDARRHNLSLDLPEKAIRLEADPVRLAQVFSNLLINAAKYTDPSGHIHLRAAKQGSDIVVAVRDDGIGIAEDMMPRLFTMFSQSRAALHRAEGGLGVGLSLVRGLVALHGGSIEVRSGGPGCGSEFIVRLPLRQRIGVQPHFEAAPALAAARAGLKVLVVDDNRDAADSLAALLEVSGHRIQTAYTARAALELAEGFLPHAVLLDIGLPDFDGYQLARRLRSSTCGGGTTLIAVTGFGQEQDRRRAFEAGIDHHLTKPVTPEIVEALLQSLNCDAAPPRAGSTG